MSRRALSLFWLGTGWPFTFKLSMSKNHAAGVSAGSFGAFRIELKFESVSPSVKTPPSVKLVVSERDSWNVMNVEREGLVANTCSQGQRAESQHIEIRKGIHIFKYSIAIEGRTL